MTLFTVADALNRSGLIAERARREGRSLSRMERNIILAGRHIARDKGVSRQRQNELEMEGERQRDHVLRPTRVVAVFAYYEPEALGEAPEPSFYIRESNHPELPAGGNVCQTQLVEASVRVPLTPTYEAWVKDDGSKVVRS